MRKLFSVVFVCFCISSSAQTIQQKLNNAVNSFLKDDQLKHAIVSMYVTDTNGNKIFSLNEQVGLAPASTQKIFTAIAAFSLLGNDFTYKTEIGYNGSIDKSILNGDLIIKGYGDPTFGSWRYAQTKPDSILSFITSSVINAGIKKIGGNVILKMLPLVIMLCPADIYGMTWVIIIAAEAGQLTGAKTNMICI